MLLTAFYWLLNMSILGSLAGLIILVLRKIKAFPRSFAYALWIIPLIRLLLPFAFSAKYSLMTLLAALGARTVALDGQTAGGQTDALSITSMNTIRAAQSYNPVVFESKALLSVFSIGAIVWLIVFFALLLMMLLLYFVTQTEIKGASHLNNNVYETDRITSPAVYGIFRQKILVPAGMLSPDLDYAVLHEAMHIRRGDNFFRCAALITACLHWFNPLIWVFLKYYFADMELACDASVMKQFDETERRQYARSLLNCLAPTRQNLFAVAFGGAKIKVRIENILSYKKLTTVACISFLVLGTAIGVALLTNA